VDSVELGERLEWKIRNKSFFKHRPMGNSSQNRAVWSDVWIRHDVTFLEYLSCDFMLNECTILATVIIRQTCK
jgi:hypothetical protein